MDEPRADKGDAIQVALAALDRRITTAIDQLADTISENDRRYTDLREADKASVKLALDAKSKEQEKFETSVTGRFDTVNEFRSSLDDLGKQMATRRELEAAVSNLSGRVDQNFRVVSDSVEKARQERQHQIDDLRRTLVELRSRLDIGPSGLDELQRRADLSAGKSDGISASAKILSGVIAAVGGVLAIIVLAANGVLSGNSAPAVETPAVVCSASYNPAPCP